MQERKMDGQDWLAKRIGGTFKVAISVGSYYSISVSSIENEQRGKVAIHRQTEKNFTGGNLASLQNESYRTNSTGRYIPFISWFHRRHCTVDSIQVLQQWGAEIICLVEFSEDNGSLLSMWSCFLDDFVKKTARFLLVIILK